MTIRRLNISNNGTATFTVTNITFNTPAGLRHTANLSKFVDGTADFTSTSFTTLTTMTTGSIVYFTVDHSYVNAVENAVVTGTIVITCTDGVEKTIKTEIITTGTSRVQKPASVEFVHQVLKKGTIVMWNGVDVPTGWQLCDGTNSTPDLRNRFIITADTDTTGVPTTSITGSAASTGGNKDEIIVSHSHGITEPNSGQGHQHPYLYRNFLQASGGNTGLPSGSSTWPTDLAYTGIDIDSNGESGTNKNLPPYYALAFIQKMTDETNITI